MSHQKRHVLTVKNVDSGYGEVQILENVTLQLERNEIVCLVGPNGAGKSTVLKTIFGLVKPWSGTIEINGKAITGMDPEDLVREGVAYVPQVENVFPSLTVEENLRMGGVARKDGLDDRLAELYDQFQLLQAKRDVNASDLSGGQRQIVALARALMMEPDVLLIDEPSAGLSPTATDDVFDHVRTVNEHGTAILMVEQNVRDGLGLADRGYVLDQGSVRFEENADSLLDDPKVSKLYLGG